jgi:hypothetical protein
VQEAVLRNKCYIKKMATSYRLRTWCKDQIANHVYDWHEIIPVSEMESIIREFFQSDITCLSGMFLFWINFPASYFCMTKFNLLKRNWIHVFQRPVKSTDECFQFFLLVVKKT